MKNIIKKISNDIVSVTEIEVDEKYKFCLNIDNDSVSYSCVVKSEEEIIKALEKSIKLISNVDEYAVHADNIKTILEDIK